MSNSNKKSNTNKEKKAPLSSFMPSKKRPEKQGSQSQPQQTPSQSQSQTQSSSQNISYQSQPERKIKNPFSEEKQSKSKSDDKKLWNFNSKVKGFPSSLSTPTPVTTESHSNDNFSRAGPLRDSDDQPSSPDSSPLSPSQSPLSPSESTQDESNPISNSHSQPYNPGKALQNLPQQPRSPEFESKQSETRPEEDEVDEDIDSQIAVRLKPGEIASHCLWVGNVASDVTKNEFRKTFESFGQVSLLRMFPKSKCAFVTFKNAKSAIKALELEGKQLGSMCLTLNVGKASRHLWVGNIGRNVSDEELRVAFAKYGTVDSVRVLRKNQCAFVNFHEESDALRAAEEMNGTELGQQKIVINFQWTDAHKRPNQKRTLHADVGEMNIGLDNLNGSLGMDPSLSHTPHFVRAFKENEFASPSRQLFVGNILSSVTEDTLWSLFTRFGEVETIKSFTNRGYAFVVYRDIRVAVFVRDQMTIYPPIVGGRALVVNFGRPVDRNITNGCAYMQPVTMHINPMTSINPLTSASMTNPLTNSLTSPLTPLSTPTLSLTPIASLGQVPIQLMPLSPVSMLSMPYANGINEVNSPPASQLQSPSQSPLTTSLPPSSLQHSAQSPQLHLPHHQFHPNHMNYPSQFQVQPLHPHSLTQHLSQSHSNTNVSNPSSPVTTSSIASASSSSSSASTSSSSSISPLPPPRVFLPSPEIESSPDQSLSKKHNGKKEESKDEKERGREDDSRSDKGSRLTSNSTTNKTTNRTNNSNSSNTNSNGISQSLTSSPHGPD